MTTKRRTKKEPKPATVSPEALAAVERAMMTVAALPGQVRTICDAHPEVTEAQARKLIREARKRWTEVMSTRDREAERAEYMARLQFLLAEAIAQGNLQVAAKLMQRWADFSGLDDVRPQVNEQAAPTAAPMREWTPETARAVLDQLRVPVPGKVH